MRAIRIGKESSPLNQKRTLLTILITILLTLAAVLSGVLLFALSGVYNVAAKDPHTPPFRWVVSKAMERSVRFHAEEI
jgi:hypothetical protein